MMQAIQITVEIFLLILGIIWLYSNYSSKYNNEHIVQLIHVIFSQLNHIQMDQVELAAQLAALTEKQTKANAEIVSKIADLENALANGGPVTVEVQTALDALKATVQASDDIVPDAQEKEDSEESTA